MDSLAATVDMDMRQDVDLKRKYATGALILMIAQVAIADAVFIGYGFAVGWNVPAIVMTAWLASTVVQVVGVTLAVTRGLFQQR